MTAATPLASSQPEQRIEALDGVRGLAILLVVMMHSLFLGVPLPGAPYLNPAFHYPRVALLGWCGVDVFFVLSGYLITGILLRSKGGPHYFRNFYVRRALRIFPLYYLVVSLLLWVMPRPATTTAEQVSYLLYYQNFRFAFGGDSNPDPAKLITWSLAIEEQFYLLWPTVVWLLSRRALAITCVAIIAGAIALRVVLLDSGVHGTHFLTPCRMDALAAGALLAAVPMAPLWLGQLLSVGGIAGLISFAYATGSSFPEHPGHQRYGLMFALAIGVGLLVLARRSTALTPLLIWRPLRSLGKYSYCIYLTHFVVIESVGITVFHHTPAGMRDWLIANVPVSGLGALFTLLTLAVSWLVAFVSWHVFEQWFLRLKRYFPSVDSSLSASSSSPR